MVDPDVWRNGESDAMLSPSCHTAPPVASCITVHVYTRLCIGVYVCVIVQLLYVNEMKDGNEINVYGVL